MIKWNKVLYDLQKVCQHYSKKNRSVLNYKVDKKHEWPTRGAAYDYNKLEEEHDVGRAESHSRDSTMGRHISVGGYRYA